MLCAVRDIWAEPCSHNQLWLSVVYKYKSIYREMEFSKKKRHHSAIGAHSSDWWFLFLVRWQNKGNDYEWKKQKVPNGK